MSHRFFIFRSKGRAAVWGCASLILLAGVAVGIFVFRAPNNPQAAPILAQEGILRPPAPSVTPVYFPQRIPDQTHTYLTAAPLRLPILPGLFSLSFFGRAPTLSSPAWLQRAVPAPLTHKPMIAIVIDDMGVDRGRSTKALTLPGPLTMAFLPYATHVQEQAAKAQAVGYELLVHVPMEPESETMNPGPYALKSAMSDQEIRQNLTQNLSVFSGYVGFNNHMGSRMTACARCMNIVLDEATKRGLLYLDSLTTSHSAAHLLHVNQTSQMPVLTRDIFIDDDMAPTAVAKQLLLIEKMARKKGYAIAIGHPHDVTLAALKVWLPTLKAKGFELVPLSAVARKEKGIS